MISKNGREIWPEHFTSFGSALVIVKVEIRELRGRQCTKFSEFFTEKCLVN